MGRRTHGALHWRAPVPVVTAPTVSILVPCYNAAHYVGALCESILRQRFANFEVLLWNDGSSDDTVSVLEPFLRDPRFRLLGVAKNQGLGKSWHQLLVNARGEFWCSPGADDVLFPDYLERRLARLRADPSSALVHGKPVNIDEAGRDLPGVLTPVCPPVVQTGDDALQALLVHNYINQPSALVRTATTRRVLPHWRNDWKYAPDWHLWLLHAATGQNVLYDDLPAHQYRIHPTSLTLAAQYAAIRRAEDRLVPLVAASGAAGLSAGAHKVWQRWRRALYALWLRRAWTVRKDLQLDELLRLGANALDQSTAVSSPDLNRECIGHAPSIIWFSLKEKWARRGQDFQPSGLAQMNHPLFARGG